MKFFAKRGKDNIAKKNVAKDNEFAKDITIYLLILQNPRMAKILKLPKFWKVFNACLQLTEAQWNSYAKLKVHLVHKLLGSGTYLPNIFSLPYQERFWTGHCVQLK